MRWFPRWVGYRASRVGEERHHQAAWPWGMILMGIRSLVARWGGAQRRESSERSVLKGHTDAVRCLAFAPDGRRLVSGSSDGSLRLWDVVTGRQQAQWPGHAGWVVATSFTPDGQALASGGNDQWVRLWDPATGRQLAS